MVHYNISNYNIYLIQKQFYIKFYKFQALQRDIQPFLGFLEFPNLVLYNFKGENKLYSSSIFNDNRLFSGVYYALGNSVSISLYRYSEVCSFSPPSILKLMLLYELNTI